MKTHIHKIGLCIGLLSFNIFSSCVNTNQELGVCTKRGASCYTFRNVRKFATRNPKETACLVGMAAFVLIHCTVVSVYITWNLLQGNALNPGMNNDGNITTIPSFMPTSGNTSTTLSDIHTTTNPQYLDQLEPNFTNALEEGDRQQWGNSTR